MSVTWNPRLLAIPASLAFVTGVALVPGMARGATQQGFVASAVAVGLRTTYKNVSDQTGTVFEGSAPIASARVTSEPDSTAFAAAPYPGDDLISLANAIGPGLGVPAQPYPFSVTSGVPGNPKSSTSQPGYALSAESTASSSKSSGTAGASSSGDALIGSSSATADVKSAADGSATALGTTLTQSFAAGPLTLSRVTSTARAVLDANGKVVLSSEVELGDATVSGQRVGVTRNGLTVAGTDIPLPAGQLTDALKASGVTVTYVAEEKSATGVTAPGLLITYKDSGQDSTFTLGRAQAGAVPSIEGFPDVPVEVGPSVPAVDGEGGSAAGEPPASGPVGSGSVPVPATVDGGQPPIAQNPAVADTPASRALVRGASYQPETFSSGLFYFVLVLAALATLAVGQLMRYLGVRWASSSS